MSYKNKYMKYKNKYLSLKNIQNGGDDTNNKPECIRYASLPCYHNILEQLKNDAKEYANSEVDILNIDVDTFVKIYDSKFKSYLTDNIDDKIMKLNGNEMEKFNGGMIELLNGIERTKHYSYAYDAAISKTREYTKLIKNFDSIIDAADIKARNITPSIDKMYEECLKKYREIFKKSIYNELMKKPVKEAIERLVNAKIKGVDSLHHEPTNFITKLYAQYNKSSQDSKIFNSLKDFIIELYVRQRTNNCTSYLSVMYHGR